MKDQIFKKRKKYLFITPILKPHLHIFSIFSIILPEFQDSLNIQAEFWKLDSQGTRKPYLEGKTHGKENVFVVTVHLNPTRLRRF